MSNLNGRADFERIRRPGLANASYDFILRVPSDRADFANSTIGMREAEGPRQRALTSPKPGSGGTCDQQQQIRPLFSFGTVPAQIKCAGVRLSYMPLREATLMKKVGGIAGVTE
jgi:hypothetical protein